MDNELCVTCHAPSLSILLYETARSTHDQRGLLIGEVCKQTISEKTDENEMNSEQRTTIYLEHCIPIKDNDLFGSIGNVNKQKLQKYIDQYCGKVVGWYSFRRNTRVNSRTLSEILTHKSLIQSVNHIRPEHFVVAFMSASMSANASTHTYNHIFMRFHPLRGEFEPLKLKIYTMSDKRTGANGYSVKNTFPTSKNFENIINPSQEEANPVVSVLTINKNIGEYLKMVNKELQDVEKSRNDLEEEIKILRKRLLLDKLQEIKVGELEREREPPGIPLIRYNPNFNYNPDRKENPIKVTPFYDIPTVPEESDEGEFRSNESEPKKISYANITQGLNSAKNSSLPRKQENTGSRSNHFEANAHGEVSMFDNNGEVDMMDRKSSNAHDRTGDSIPDRDENEQQLDKTKVTGHYS